MTVRVVIVDDHRVVRDGLCYLLTKEPDIEVVGEAGDGRQALSVVAATRPDVVLLDLYMPRVDGHGVLAAFRDTPHSAAIVVLTSATDDEQLVRAMQGGATSYLLKTAPAEDVVNAVRHGNARRLTVSTARCEGRIELTVRDNGSGFDPVAPYTGSGLAHIRDRVTELGGTVTIDSAPGCGATLAVRIPAP